MITVISEFKLPEAISLEKAEQLFMGSAPSYQVAKGLVRKYYMLTEDGSTVCGTYLWETRADAEAVFDEKWREYIKEKYGSYPTVTYYNTPVIVDNLTQEIISG